MVNNIGILYGNFKGREYVLFEAKKWEKVLINLGYDIFYFDILSLFPSGYFESLMDKLFKKDKTLPSEIECINREIGERVFNFIKDKDIDLLLIEDLCSSVYSLFFVKGMTWAVGKAKIKALMHHHNLWWNNLFLPDYLRKHYLNVPPHNPDMVHIVLNSIDQERLFRKRGIRARIVPYMCDFDIMSDEDREEKDTIRIFFPDISYMKGDIAFKIGKRLEREVGKKIEILKSNSLDLLFSSDIMVYPAIWIGWGPYILEAVCGKISIIISQYKVYKRDISPFEFDFISIGDMQDKEIESGANKTLDLLTNRERKEKIVNHNVEIVKTYFSLSMLRDYIQAILRDL